MKNYIITAAVLLAFLIGFSLRESQAQANTRQFNVPLQTLPTSAAAPTAAQGGTLTGSLFLEYVTMSNPDTVSHTVLVEDGQGTPVTLFNNFTIAAGSMWSVPVNVRMTSGVKWSASSALVTGGLTGSR